MPSRQVIIRPIRQSDCIYLTTRYIHTTHPPFSQVRRTPTNHSLGAAVDPFSTSDLVVESRAHPSLSSTRHSCAPPTPVLLNFPFGFLSRLSRFVPLSTIMSAYPPTPVASPKVSNSSLVSHHHPDRSPRSPSNNLGVFSNPSTPESMTKSPLLTGNELSSSSSFTNETHSSSVFATPFRQSSAPREPGTTFNSLPPLIQLQILELALHDSGYATLTPNLLDFSDPRFVNHNFFTLLDRRNVWRRLLRVNKLGHAFFAPKLYSPAVVTSMAQLNALSGYSYPERDQKKKGRQNPMFHTGDFNPHDSQTNIPCHAKRKKIGDWSGKEVKELVLIIANLPGMLDSNVGPRFPEWYIQDWMRYDLEVLGVERLTVLAPSKGDFYHLFPSFSLSLPLPPSLSLSLSPP